jgi:hypothetical protein
MHLPLIVTLVITFSLDQELQSVVAHAAVHNHHMSHPVNLWSKWYSSLDLILFLTIDKSWGWWWCQSLARDGIRKHRGQFDYGEYRVEVVEVGGES